MLRWYETLFPLQMEPNRSYAVAATICPQKYEVDVRRQQRGGQEGGHGAGESDLLVFTLCHMTL